MDIDSIPYGHRIENAMFSHQRFTPRPQDWNGSNVIQNFVFEQGNMVSVVVTKETRIIRSALASVLVDESFTIPTEEARICLEIAQGLVNLYIEPTIHCAEFSCWLSSTLQDIIVKSIKHNS